MKFFTYLAFIILLLGCSNKTIYSGKVINQEDFNSINFQFLKYDEFDIK